MWCNSDSLTTKPSVRTERVLAGANDGYCLTLVDGVCTTWIRMFQHFDALDMLENYDA